MSYVNFRASCAAGVSSLLIADVRRIKLSQVWSVVLQLRDRIELCQIQGGVLRRAYRFPLLDKVPPSSGHQCPAGLD
jgi:hypothetical protein